MSSPQSVENNNEQHSFVAVTWYIDPHPDEYEASAETICRLLDTFHPDVVMMQNLDAKMVDLLTNNDSLKAHCYLLFPGPKKFDQNGKGCGFIVRQPCDPISIGTRKIKVTKTKDINCSFCRVKSTHETVFFLATASLSTTDPELRQQQYQVLLKHLNQENNVILGLSTFDDDTDSNNEYPLIVPLSSGWHDAWWNFDCPIARTHTVDAGNNVLVQNGTVARYDRMLYRMPARVKAMGFLGRKPMTNVRRSCPPSSHYALVVKWAYHTQTYEDFESDENDPKEFWSVCELNAVSKDSFYKGDDFTQPNQQPISEDQWDHKVTTADIKNMEKARTIFEIEKTVLDQHDDIDVKKTSDEEFVRSIIFSGAEGKTRSKDQPTSFSQAYQRLLNERSRLLQSLGPQPSGIRSFGQQTPQHTRDDQGSQQQNVLEDDNRQMETEEQVRSAVFGTSGENTDKQKMNQAEIDRLLMEREQDDQLFKSTQVPRM
uniref:5'-tyrosyl-DNA phosphodiesterase n=1 Tax=Clandestinovirus TaxID=2831644 RepID=A0A8F8KQF9_9VIRU|nr:5'-tyrosyl-DNA phosphodiesterase [Clandestinovirus]